MSLVFRVRITSRIPARFSVEETTCSFQHFYGLRTSHVFTAYTFPSKLQLSFQIILKSERIRFFLQDGNPLLLTSSTSGQNHSRSEGNSLWAKLAISG